MNILDMNMNMNMTTWMTWIMLAWSIYLELLEKIVHGDYMSLTRTWWHGYSWYLVHVKDIHVL